MLEFLIPVGMFWIMAALYIGGMGVRIEGGSGPREVFGLLATFVLFVVAWQLLNAALGAVLPYALGLVVATVVCVVLLPVWTRIGFRVLGVRVSGGTFAS